MMNRTRWTGVLVTALATTTAPAWAQTAGAGAPATPPATPPAAGAGDADTYFREGNEHFKQKKWADAEAAYEQAFRLRKAHDIAASLGDTELNQGKHREAAEHLSFALRNWAATVKYTKRDVEERLAKARKEVAKLRIKVSIDGATVLLDGVQVGTSPMDTEVFVEPGEHSVEAQREKHWNDNEKIDTEKGTEHEVVLKPYERPNGGADDADRYFRYGNHLYKNGHWKEAEAMYEEAFRRKKSHDIAANLGYAELNQGKHCETVEHLSFAVQNWAPTSKGDKKRFAEERLAMAKSEVTMLRIKVNVAGAEVLIDGASRGRSPLESAVCMKPGPHWVEARHERLVTARELVLAPRGAEKSVDLTLEEIPVLSQGQVIAIGAVAGTALVAGVVLAIAANVKSTEAENLRDQIGTQDWLCHSSVSARPEEPCNSLQSAVDAEVGMSNAAMGLFIAGGVIAVGTAGYMVWERTRRREPRDAMVRVLPLGGPQSAGIAVRGAW